jgi:CBS domain-containing protein
MHKPLRELMQQHLVLVAMDDPIEKVERLFRIHRQAFAVVLNSEQQYYGLVSASHLLGFQLVWKNTGAVLVHEICQQRVIAAPSSLPLREAADLMLRKNAEYLVVMDDAVVVGVVPVLSLLRELLLLLDPEEQSVRDDKGYFGRLSQA